MHANQVREGMDVLDMDGEKIGKAGETLAGGRYFNVDSGFLGTKEYYVPFDAVREVRGDSVYVNARKDELNRRGWDRRPEEHGTGVRTGAASDAGERQTVQLREEELLARKQQVETGRVQVGKEIVEEQKTLEVPVTREEVYVERRPVERRPSDAPIDDRAEGIRVPVREERVEVEKTPVVYEEVGLEKRQVQETRQVSDTVRREEARIENQADVNVEGVSRTGATGTWQTAMPRYRTRWQQRYGASGGRWEDYEPSYRYGYELRNRPEYRGRKWSEVEADVQRDWTRHNPTIPWNRAKESVREAWESATDR